jgi:dTDP-4-dehydrorhamnose reductase
MNRILLTGVTGQVGYELKTLLPTLGEVVGLGRQDLDLTQPTMIRQVVHEVQPQLIINAAAYTAVDKAESEAELAQAINGIAPTVLAESAQQLAIPLIHISTDYVFDGTKNTPYSEDDPTHPLGAYGRSKLMGENGIRQNCEQHFIFRTAWVYGTHGHGNFVKTMLRLGANRGELRVVVDQVGTPTWSQDLAKGIYQAVLALFSSPGSTPLAPGIYHFTNSGLTSWYDFAIAIFEEARSLGLPLEVSRVVPITTSEYPTPAKRPAYSVLSNQKLSAILGNYPPHWRQSLRQMLMEREFEEWISAARRAAEIH